jgi:hypothetical protein
MVRNRTAGIEIDCGSQRLLLADQQVLASIRKVLNRMGLIPYPFRHLAARAGPQSIRPVSGHSEPGLAGAKFDPSRGTARRGMAARFGSGHSLEIGLGTRRLLLLRSGG